MSIIFYYGTDNKVYGPHHESTVQAWYRSGFFSSDVKFEISTGAGFDPSGSLFTLGELVEKNGRALPFFFSGEKENREREQEETVKKLKEIISNNTSKCDRNDTKIDQLLKKKHEIEDQFAVHSNQIADLQDWKKDVEGKLAACELAMQSQSGVMANSVTLVNDSISRLTQAHKSATLAARVAPPKKAWLASSLTNDELSLGRSKMNKWSGGASEVSENSKKEDRAAAIHSARFMGTGQRSLSSVSMKGPSASGTATKINSEDERERNELREIQEKGVTKRLQCDIGDFHSGEISLEECRTEVFNVVDAEKFQKPSHATVFKCLMAAAVKKAESTSNNDERLVILAKFGHVLSFSLLKLHEEKDTKTRDEILKGVAESCREVVEQEQWEDNQRIWNFYAEVLINAHLPTEGLFEGAHPSLGDFKDAFLHAAKDTRKPYTLFVLVLKRLAEMHYKLDKDSCMEIVSWVLDEDCKLIMKHVHAEKLDNALKETEMEFAENLFMIMRQGEH